jgi:Uma2 family endonuclease
MNVLARALETSQQHRFTLDDVLRMQEVGILDGNTRVELIDGALIEKAREGVPHTLMKMRVARQLIALGGEALHVMIGSTLRLAPTFALDPDLYVYKASLAFSTVTGSNVGLVVEIAQSTATRDRTLKAELYAQHGVRDYWVVDVNTDTVIVHREPVDGVYRDITRHSALDTVTAVVLPSVALSLADLPPIR